MTGDDGWTFVPAQGRRRRGHHQSSTTTATPTNDRPAWPPVSRDLTIAKMQADLTVKQRLWRTSDARRQILQILDRLRSTTRPTERWTVDHAVCLGTGSFSRDNLDTRRRSVFQLVAFLDLVDILCEGSSESLAREEMVLVAQDPAYTALDVAFLRTLGVEVCSSRLSTSETAPANSGGGGGDALGQMKSTSFVCEWFMERRPEFLSRLLDAEVELVVGSMLTDPSRIALQRSRITGGLSQELTRLRGEGRNATELEAYRQAEQSKLMFVELEERYNRHYRPYRMPRFEPDPNIFEGLHIAARVAVQSDDGDD